MKFIAMYSIRPGCLPEAAKRFLQGKATPPAGLKLLGRWHKTDGSGGFSLFESDNPSLMYEFTMSWADVLESHGSAVVEDAEAGPILAKIFGK
jgi:Protein of unknown function (DUF3303).